jgi:hypothetical protein
MDPNIERFTKVECIIQDALRHYHEIYEEKKSCSNEAQHVPHQDDISYLNPRTLL